MSSNKYPPGWNEERVRKVLAFYESQSDEAAAAEISSASKRTTMEVPTALVPIIRRMIAGRTSSRSSRPVQTKIRRKPAKKPRAGRS